MPFVDLCHILGITGRFTVREKVRVRVAFFDGTSCASKLGLRLGVPFIDTASCILQLGLRSVTKLGLGLG